MHAMNLEYIYLPETPPESSSSPFSSQLYGVFFFCPICNPQSPVCVSCMLVGMGHLLKNRWPSKGLNPKEIDSPSLRSHQLPTAPQLGVGCNESLPTLFWKANWCDLMLVFVRQPPIFWVHEFMSTKVLSYPGDTISPPSSLITA